MRVRRLTGEDVGKSVFVLVLRILGGVVDCRGLSIECLHGNHRARLEGRGRGGGEEDSPGIPAQILCLCPRASVGHVPQTDPV